MNATSSCNAMHSVPHRPVANGASGRAAARQGMKPDAEAATALKNVLFFFSLVFRYPDETLYGELARHLDTFGDVFRHYAGSVPGLPAIEDLQAEYVGLFVNNQGFVPAVPYASCHLDNGLVMGPTYDAVRRLMGETGFAVEAAKELEDHLAVLLEFAASLVCSLGLPAEKRPETADAAASIDALARITFDIVEPMIDRFAAGVADYAVSGFYRTAAAALAAFIHDAGAVYEEVLGLFLIPDETTNSGVNR